MEQAIHVSSPEEMMDLRAAAQSEGYHLMTGYDKMMGVQKMLWVKIPAKFFRSSTDTIARRYSSQVGAYSKYVIVSCSNRDN